MLDANLLWRACSLNNARADNEIQYTPDILDLLGVKEISELS